MSDLQMLLKFVPTNKGRSGVSTATLAAARNWAPVTLGTGVEGSDVSVQVCSARKSCVGIARAPEAHMLVTGRVIGRQANRPW